MRKYCHKPSDVPKVKHYAILTFDSITIPGDERSRTHPGHGYPEHTQSTVDYVAYTDRGEWEKEVSRLATDNDYGRKDFTAIVVEPAEVKREIKVSIGG